MSMKTRELDRPADVVLGKTGSIAEHLVRHIPYGHGFGGRFRADPYIPDGNVLVVDCSIFITDESLLDEERALPITDTGAIEVGGCNGEHSGKCSGDCRLHRLPFRIWLEHIDRRPDRLLAWYSVEPCGE